MINARRQRMRITKVFINRLAADATDCLCSIDRLFVPLERKAVRSILVWSIALARRVSLICHAVTSPPRGHKKRGQGFPSDLRYYFSDYSLAQAVVTRQRHVSDTAHLLLPDAINAKEQCSQLLVCSSDIPINSSVRNELFFRNLCVRFLILIDVLGLNNTPSANNLRFS